MYVIIASLICSLVYLVLRTAHSFFLGCRSHPCLPPRSLSLPSVPDPDSAGLLCVSPTISQIATVQTLRSISLILLRPRRLRSGGDDGSTMTNVVSSFPVNLLPLCLAGPSIQGEALHRLMNLLFPPRCFVQVHKAQSTLYLSPNLADASRCMMVRCSRCCFPMKSSRARL